MVAQADSTKLNSYPTPDTSGRFTAPGAKAKTFDMFDQLALQGESCCASLSDESHLIVLRNDTVSLWVILLQHCISLDLESEALTTNFHLHYLRGMLLSISLRSQQLVCTREIRSDIFRLVICKNATAFSWENAISVLAFATSEFFFAENKLIIFGHTNK